MENFKLILLNCPYDSREDELVQRYFGKIIQFKINGYLTEYPYGTLPFCASDFIADHFLLINQENDEILMAFKSITLERCLAHNVRFPMLGMIETVHEEDQRENLIAIQDMIKTYIENKKTHQLAYQGSLTVKPELRKNKELMTTIWELTHSILVNYFTEQKLDRALAICSKKFKVDEKNRIIGWNEIYHQEKALKSFPCKSLANEIFLPMNVQEHSFEGYRLAKKYKNIWDAREQSREKERIKKAS